MSVLVTGGAGYIGSHLTADLVEAGEDVVVVDDLRSGCLSAVPATAVFVNGNAGDRLLVDRILKEHKCSAIIHLAASTDVADSIREPSAFIENNCTVTSTLLDCAKEARVKQFIFSSSAAVYGEVSQNPVRETASTIPISPYGRTKLASEHMVQHAAQSASMSYAVLRYFNVAGSDMRHRTGQTNRNANHLIRRACQSALGTHSILDIYGDNHDTPDGTGIRDYIHVNDLSQALLLTLRHLRNGYDSFIANCGSGRGYSVREVIACVEEVSGSVLEVRIADPRSGEIGTIVANVEFIRSLLGWVPKCGSLTEIVRSTFEWERYLANGPVENWSGTPVLASHHLAKGKRRASSSMWRENSVPQTG